MAWVFQRDGKWVIKWKDAAGRYRQRRSDCATKLEAKTLAREISRKAEFQRVGLQAPDAPTRLTFVELLDWYWETFGSQLRSKGSRFSADRHLRPALGDLVLTEVTAGAVDEVLSALEKGDAALSPKSINNLRTFVQSLFSRASQRGLWTGVNPAAGIPRRKVPKRVPSYLKPEEVTVVLPQVPTQWRALFACAVYTGMRRGELVALRKGDVDLQTSALTVARSWDANTTKGKRADVLPIHPELKPYLADAIRRSPSEQVFPRADGSMHRDHIDLAEILRRAMKRAGLVEGWTLKCRRCGHAEPSTDADTRGCPECDFALWPVARARRVRFHDLRHTTATLLLKAGVSLAIVQRILRHSSPTVTAAVYGHLDLSDMDAALQRLSFTPKPEVRAEVVVLPVAGNDDFGAPVVRNLSDDAPRSRHRDAIPEAKHGVEISGPSWIRTKDQSVMSRQL